MLLGWSFIYSLNSISSGKEIESTSLPAEKSSFDVSQSAYLFLITPRTGLYIKAFQALSK